MRLLVFCCFFQITYVRIVVLFSRNLGGCRSRKDATPNAVLLRTSLAFTKAQTISCPSSLHVRACPYPRPIACRVLPSGGIVVELSPVQSLVADCPFFYSTQALTICHITDFFYFRNHSRLGLFHPYVVVLLSLGVSSS